MTEIESAGRRLAKSAGHTDDMKGRPASEVSASIQSELSQFRQQNQEVMARLEALNEKATENGHDRHKNGDDISRVEDARGQISPSRMKGLNAAAVS